MNPMSNNPMNPMQAGMPIQPHVMHAGINQHHMGVITPQGMIPAHMVNIQQIQSQQQIPQQQLQQQQLQQQQLQQQQQQIQQQQIQQQLTPQQQLPTQQQILPQQQQQLIAQQQQLSNQQQLTPQQQLQLQQQQQITLPSQPQLLQQQQQESMIQQLNSPHKTAPAETASPDQTDPVFRAKLLLPRLKEAYKKLMADSACALKENISADSGNSAFEGSVGSPEASFETFNEILDLMECNLRLALDTMSVSKESSKYAPSCVQVYSNDTPSSADSLPYPQYLALCKNQVAFGGELKEILTRGMKKIAEHSSLPQPVDQN